MQNFMASKTGLPHRLISGPGPRPPATFILVVLTGLFLCACNGQSRDAAVDAANNSDTPAEATAAHVMEKGMFFKPVLDDYALHNEYDDDGDGDGVKETHVRRYIDSKGDTAFSLTTNGKLWAWSLDTREGDESDIHKNFVIRDSNCDGVFDERYSLDAEFHVPACLLEAGAANEPGSPLSRPSQ